jgi:hypothetical protein
MTSLTFKDITIGDIVTVSHRFSESAKSILIVGFRAEAHWNPTVPYGVNVADGTPLSLKDSDKIRFIFSSRN